MKLFEQTYVHQRQLMSTSDRERPFDSAHFGVFERPLSGKADIQDVAVAKCLLNVRFAPDSGRWAVES